MLVIIGREHGLEIIGREYSCGIYWKRIILPVIGIKIN